MNRLFDHVDLRVRDLDEARRFYDAFLAALGFGPAYPTPIGIAYDALRDHPKPEFIGLIEDRGHRATATRLAFWADSVAEVDRITAVAKAAGALRLEGPEYCPEYTPTYYAAFFEDPCGNRLEVCFRLAPPRPA